MRRCSSVGGQFRRGFPWGRHRIWCGSSPHSEVSGTHVEVKQQGSSIIVTDLKSTNATVVLVPGAVPLRLRQGESVVVTPGTVVDIGDGNRIEILPTQRLI